MLFHDTALIPLRSRDRSTIRAHAIVDAEDEALVNGYGRWYQLRGGYVVKVVGTRKKYGVIYLHRVLLGLSPGDGLEVDHINRNKLDNRRVNLRIVTKQENAQNLTNHRGGTSSFRGVSWDVTRNKWIACVHVHGKSVYRARFDNELDAAETAILMRLEYMPHSTN